MKSASAPVRPSSEPAPLRCAGSWCSDRGASNYREYLSGANTRRIAGALLPLLKAAPLSKRAVSRVVGTLKSELATWEKRPLVELEVAFLYLDAIALRVRTSTGSSTPRAKRPLARRTWPS